MEHSFEYFIAKQGRDVEGLKYSYPSSFSRPRPRPRPQFRLWELKVYRSKLVTKAKRAQYLWNNSKRFLVRSYGTMNVISRNQG